MSAGLFADAVAVTTTSQHQEADLTFLEWLASPAGAEAIAATGAIPALSLPAGLDEVKKFYGAGGRDAVARPYRSLNAADPRLAAVLDVLKKQVAAFIAGRQNLDDTIGNIQRGVSAVG